jgi:hypothetical protein
MGPNWCLNSYQYAINSLFFKELREENKMSRDVIVLVMMLVMGIILSINNYCFAGTKKLTFAWEQPSISSDFKGWQLQVTNVAPPESWTNEKSTWINDPRTEWSDAVFIEYNGSGEVNYVSDFIMTSPDGQVVQYWYRLASEDHAGNKSCWNYGSDGIGLCSEEIDFEAPLGSQRFTVEITVVSE